MLNVEAIDLHYGAAQALRRVSVSAEIGKVTCVMGRNGVGKTSLMRAIVGHQPISGGHIRLDGEDISALRSEDRARAGIAYSHAAGLGGFRKAAPDSPNAGWRNLSFRGYADYMQTREFAHELAGLMDRACTAVVCIMCAEAVPWRCHRSLVADALIAHGVGACEIVSPTRLQAHKLTSFARVSAGRVTYPPAHA